MVTGLCIQRLERHLVEIFYIDRTGYQDSFKYDRRVNNIIFFLILDNISSGNFIAANLKHLYL